MAHGNKKPHLVFRLLYQISRVLENIDKILLVGVIVSFALASFGYFNIDAYVNLKYFNYVLAGIGLVLGRLFLDYVEQFLVIQKMDLHMKYHKEREFHNLTEHAGHESLSTNEDNEDKENNRPATA